KPFLPRTAETIYRSFNFPQAWESVRHEDVWVHPRQGEDLRVVAAPEGGKGQPLFPRITCVVKERGRRSLVCTAAALLSSDMPTPGLPSPVPCSAATVSPGIRPCTAPRCASAIRSIRSPHSGRGPCRRRGSSRWHKQPRRPPASGAASSPE